MMTMPDGDKWRLLDTDIESQEYGKSFIFDYSGIESAEIRNVVKRYIWENYRAGNRTVKGMTEMMRSMRLFSTFCNEKGISSFKELSSEDIDDYMSFLRVRISPHTGRPYAYATQSSHFSALKTIIGWCHAFMPEAVPSKQIFTGYEYRNTYAHKVKIQFIPDDVMDKINDALEDEDNVYLKYGIQILESTGMRIGDMLLLRTDCIAKHPISGWTITWFNHKSRKEMKNLPISDKCRTAVQSLLEYTADIRQEADDSEKEYLFIYKPKIGTNKKSIVRIKKQAFTIWCNSFCENHDVRNSDGKVFRLTTHMFRRTLATDMISKGANLNVIKEVMGHADPATTKRYYADVKDPYRKELFERIGILGNIHAIDDSYIQDTGELKWFQENCENRARLSDGYCTVPIHNGEPCGRFLSRQKCYMCSRYITTVDDLDTHKTHLAELEDMLANNIYGEHFASHIKPTVIILREIIRRLEELKSGS